MKRDAPGKNDVATRSNPHPRAAPDAGPRRVARGHRFAVGDAVTLLARVGDIRLRELEEEFEAGRFAITRLLPAEGESFQYRIKDLTTGRERVVVEEQIARFGAEELP